MIGGAVNNIFVSRFMGADGLVNMGEKIGERH